MRIPLIQQIVRVAAISLAASFAAASRADEIARVEHLLQAAEHLQHAGENKLADEIRQCLLRDHRPALETLRNKINTELKRLNYQVERIDHVLNVPPNETHNAPSAVSHAPSTEGNWPIADTSTPAASAEQVLVTVRVVEIDREKLKAIGMDWQSLHFANYGDAATTFVDDGNIVQFVKMLREQRLAKVLAEPAVATVSGRAATVEIGTPPEQSDGSVGGSYFRFEVLPTVLDNDRIRIGAKICYATRTNSETNTAGRNDTNTTVELDSGQTAVIAGAGESRTDDDQRSTLVLLTAERFDSENHTARTIDRTFTKQQ